MFNTYFPRGDQYWFFDDSREWPQRNLAMGRGGSSPNGDLIPTSTSGYLILRKFTSFEVITFSLTPIFLVMLIIIWYIIGLEK